jgi:Na+-driven multidrug efflux pump
VFWFLTSMMWAVSMATKVRIAHHLGAGDVPNAKLSQVHPV